MLQILGHVLIQTLIRTLIPRQDVDEMDKISSCLMTWMLALMLMWLMTALTAAEVTLDLMIACNMAGTMPADSSTEDTGLHSPVFCPQQL